MTTKTIAVLPHSDLQDGQMKEVAFGDGKVLLSRLGDKIHATSAFCTHYGAPLSKGVLAADGRVVCPWHGACFNVCTGDIEDAPGPAPLHSFKVSIEDGQIHVTADPSQTTPAGKARPPKVAGSSEEPGPGVVVVGGGSGAYGVVESLREFGYKKSITVISKEPHAPIDRTKLSKALVSEASKLELRSPAELKIKLGVTLRTNSTVTHVDTDRRIVILENQEGISYESLVLSTGAIPRRLPVEGTDGPNVYVLRDIEHTKLLDEACKEGKRLVIIGTSFIGLEAAVAVSKRKLASIDMVSLTEFPLEAVLGKAVGAGIQKFQESQGVKFHASTSVSAIRSKDDGSSEVELSSGVALPADVVLMAVGVRPATDFLKDSGFELERDGSLSVDEYLRVPGRENVYAIGDIATYKQVLYGGSRRIEHWNVAQNHGRAVGKTIAGLASGKQGWMQPFVKVPIFWSAQGQQLRYCGIDTSYDNVIIKGDPNEMKFIAYYVNAGKIIAVATMQHDPIVSKAAELFRLGLMPTPDEVRAGKSPLEVDISTESAKARVSA
ncbi:flavoprotein [Vararia minispora EC-137]|uniref:Flavoprotein n=1 Tax=Vararia minispora EC-137 TaxID=1314806 RepID=A0ACB8QKZ2_9AGAM|nr:flavoprotein [Vararia minispora EC-137]